MPQEEDIMIFFNNCSKSKRILDIKILSTPLAQYMANFDA